MQEIIEKLLILQDRNRKILRVSQELEHIGPERTSLQARDHSRLRKSLYHRKNCALHYRLRKFFSVIFV